MDTLTRDTLVQLVEASLDRYDGTLRSAISDGASGIYRAWQDADLRPSEDDAIMSMVDVAERQVVDATKAAIIEAMVEVAMRIRDELPDAPLRGEPVEDVIAEARAEVEAERARIDALFAGRRVPA